MHFYASFVLTWCGFQILQFQRHIANLPPRSPSFHQRQQNPIRLSADSFKKREDDASRNQTWIAAAVGDDYFMERTLTENSARQAPEKFFFLQWNPILSSRFSQTRSFFCAVLCILFACVTRELNSTGTRRIEPNWSMGRCDRPEPENKTEKNSWWRFSCGFWILLNWIEYTMQRSFPTNRI